LVAYLVSLRPLNTVPAQNPAIPLRSDRVSSGETTKESKTGG
jgi:hypothetical protein